MMLKSRANRWVVAAAALAASALSVAAGLPDAPPLPPEARQWIQQMQTQRLGPFSEVRWFCNDGAVLPPVPYACVERGGGRQHGVLGPRAQQLRAAGVPLGNVLAGLDRDVLVADRGLQLRNVLVERYLLQAHDGWIYRQTRYARGAFQFEDEEKAANAIVDRLVADVAPLQKDFLLLREAARLLPRSREAQGLGEIRGLSSSLAQTDPGFVPLRNKIHSQPDQTDAAAVRNYAKSVTATAQHSEFARLAGLLDAAYAFTLDPERVQRLAAATNSAYLKRIAHALETGSDPLVQLEPLGSLLVELRRRLPSYPPALRVEALDLSLAAEQRAFVLARAVAPEQLSRRQLVEGLQRLAQIAYGSGLLNHREYDALRPHVLSLQGRDLSVEEYAGLVRYFSLVPEWAARQLLFYFSGATHAFARVEPLAHGFVPDRLRGSTLLSYGEWLEHLSTDANRQVGIVHTLFGRTVNSGLRALNPGLARGTLRELVPGQALQTTDIVIAPSTVPELPRVGGILTADAGNLLSHVQLLASNLGIPNVMLNEQSGKVISRHLNKPVTLAVSPGGVVRLEADRGQLDAIFEDAGKQPAQALKIDVDKLDLDFRQPISLRRLGVADSGRRVGPKAAQLAELAQQFPGMVSAGLVIPFGAFRAVLDRPMAGEDTSAFVWMTRQYDRLQTLPPGRARDAWVEDFLARLRNWIQQEAVADDLRNTLRRAMQEEFGADGSYGVFVRSDTNVEDLPGFTGAGLNLTVPNVVGFDNVLAALVRVWASPFTERAFRWRQAVVDRPEHVYPSVLLHQTVPGDKSGVMITADLYDQQPGWVTIAVNEGVGGGVDGQSAETVQLTLDGREERLLACATEPEQRVVDPKGGSTLIAASGAPRLLFPSEAEQLLAVARALPQRYPSLRDEQGNAVPADVEFAFVKGRLYLNQIRPFVQNRRARQLEYLAALDERPRSDRKVTMDQRP